LFNELFAKEISNRKPAARRALAKVLLNKAQEASANPADQIVLLVGARQAAEDAKDLTLCFLAIDALAEHFDVDALRLKTKSASVVTATRAETSVLNEANCAEGLRMIDELVAKGSFVDAARLVRYLVTLSLVDPSLSAEAKWQAKRIDQIQKAHDRLAKVFERLTIAPDDPAANAAVGQFLCFYQGAWEMGLKALAKGSEIKLKDLAASEIAARDGKDAALAADIADRWWQIAEAEPEIPRDIIRKHAAGLYERAMVVTSGLRRDVMANRIALVQAGTRVRWIVLLRSDDPSIWNHPAGRPTDDNSYAADVGSAPPETTFLRIRRMDTGDAVIIPMKQEDLLKMTPTWCGTAWTGYGGTHVGIKDPSKKKVEKGLVDIDANYQGWGFGHVMYVPEESAHGYAWAGTTIDKTVFEISVTREELNSSERKMLVGGK
jgi:Arc/MetJ-type ribon-helix-helix transcriptional regulator